MRLSTRLIAIAAVSIVLQGAAFAQDPAPAPPPGAAQQTAASQQPAARTPDPDLAINFAQPDFTLITLPTTLRLPRHRSAFRVTHRFTRTLGEGDFGDLLGDAFGLDRGAVIGLEYRFAIFRGTQVGVHRTSGKTIEFFGEYNLMNQDADTAFGLNALVSIDGTNNFRDRYSPALGAVLSRTFGQNAAVYFQPIWVNNSNPLPDELSDDNDTILYSVSARVRIRPTVYLVGEYVPRTGFKGQTSLTVPEPPNYAGFAIEKRLGLHVFQLNFANGFPFTISQLARGGESNDDWFLGFNITRKFYR
jgi:hypothetical protein